MTRVSSGAVDGSSFEAELLLDCGEDVCAGVSEARVQGRCRGPAKVVVVHTGEPGLVETVRPVDVPECVDHVLHGTNAQPGHSRGHESTRR